MTTTTITIKEKECFIQTDLDTAKKLIMKNPRCVSELNDDGVALVYQTEQLNTLTALINGHR